MPNELLLSKVESKTKDKKTTVKTTSKELNSLEAMRVSLEEERTEEMNVLQEKLTDEKNNAYEQLKYLNALQGKEETLEKKLKEKHNLDCFIKIDETNIEAVCISSKHDNQLANNIMRSLQEEYTEKMYITVKFQKK